MTKVGQQTLGINEYDFPSRKKIFQEGNTKTAEIKIVRIFFVVIFHLVNVFE